MKINALSPLAFLLGIAGMLQFAAGASAQAPMQVFSSGGAYITKANDKAAGEAHIVDNTENGGTNDDFAIYDFATRSNLPAKRVATSITISMEADLHGKYEHAGALDFYLGTNTSVGIGNADTGNHFWDTGPSGAKDNPVQVLPSEGLGLGSGLGIGSYFGTPSMFLPIGQGQWNTGALLQQFTFTLSPAAQLYVDKQLSSKGVIRLFIADDSHHSADGDAEVTVTPPWITFSTAAAP